MTPAGPDLRATRRSRDAWVGFTIVTAVLLCCAIVAMYAMQASAIARVVDRGRELRTAHLNLFQGFLHVSLSESADSVWDRGRGLALVRQGARDMQRSLSQMQGALPEGAYTATAEAISRELETFTTAVRHTPPAAAANSLELRVSFYRLNALASEVERNARVDIQLLRERQRVVFWAMLAGSALLLVLVARGAVRAGAREDLALRSQQDTDLRFRQLAESIGEVFWLFDIEAGTVLFVNDAARTVWGRPAEEFMRDPGLWLAALHPDDRDRMRARTSARAAYQEEYRIRHPDGSTRWVRERAFLVHDGDGRAYRLAGVAEDITERRLAESRTAVSERRLRDIIDLVPHLIYAKDAGGRLILANRATARYMGCEPHELLGRTLLELGIDPKDAQERSMEDQRLLAGGGRIEGVVVDRARRGEHVVLMLNKMPFNFADEAIDSVLVAATDITALKTAESQLKQTVALLASTLESTDNGVLVSDAHGSVLLWNKRLLNFLVDPTPLESRAEAAVLDALGISPRRSAASDMVVRREDGSYLEYHIQPMDIDGTPAGFVWTFRDVSMRELGALQAQQREQELEARVCERTRELAQAYQELESFSHAVSHDLRAPLSAIDTFMHVLVRRHGSGLDADARHYIDMVAEASDSMRQMIAALLELSAHAQAPAQRQLLDITRMAHAAYDLHRDTLSPRRVEFVVQEGLRARGDPALVATLLQNLIGNALKYSSGRDPARVEVAAEEGSVTRFRVRDNGAGFDPAQAHRLFKPFSRLHSSEEFQGHGIGLATSARIVARHSGRIWAEAAPGRGATFWFTLE